MMYQHYTRCAEGYEHGNKMELCWYTTAEAGNCLPDRKGWIDVFRECWTGVIVPWRLAKTPRVIITYQAIHPPSPSPSIHCKADNRPKNSHKRLGYGG